MKTLIAALILFASVTFVAFAADVTIPVVLNDKQQAGLKAAADKFNATLKTAFDSAEAAKKAADPAYVLKVYNAISAANYFKQRAGDLADSYAAAELIDAAEEPPNKTAQQKFLALPEVERAKIRTAIDVATAANP